MPCILLILKKSDFYLKIDIDIPKIDSFILAIFYIVIATFSINDKNEKIKFFKQSFLLANISFDIIFEIFFLTLNNIDNMLLE